MNFGRTKEVDEVGFDLTAMIDIVLLLIIFFVLTAQFGKTMLSNIDLPREPGAPVAASGPEQVVIDVTREGGYRVEGAEIEIDRLTQLIAADMRKGKALDVLVRAERSGSAMHVNRLASALAVAGVRDWKLATLGAGQSGGGNGGGGG